MSTEAAVVVSTPAPGAPVSGGDDFTPEERAYFDSKGENTDGLSSDPASATVPKTATADAAPMPNGDDESVDGEVALDVNGNVRDLKSGKFVPKSAFLRVKEEAKQTKADVQKLRDDYIATRERLAIMTEATAPAPQTQQQEEREPDPETDLFAWVAWSRRQMTLLKDQLTKTSTETREQFESRSMQEAFKSDVHRFQQNTPGFTQGYSYLVNQRHVELNALGVRDQAKREAIIAEEARDLVTNAIRNRESPAALLYQLATARGYQPKAANDDAAAKAAQEIDRIKQGQQASNSLRSAGSGSGVGEQLSVQKLADMSDNEYTATRASYISRHGKAAWTKVTGMG